MAFCLVPKLAERFKQMIISGEINIGKLNDMTSEERLSFFAKEFGERNAKEINALFESKLLLKYQKRGLVTWAKTVGGMKPRERRDLIDRIENMREILTPQNEDAFLKSLASKRIGTDISIDEAKKISKLSEKVSSLENYKTDAQRIAYGEARLDLVDYVNSLNPKKAYLATNILNIPRGVMASLDLSAPLNQGWGMISRKQFYKALPDMIKYAKNEGNLKKLQADIITRPKYKEAKKAGLRLTDLSQNLNQREEQFMSSILDRVPGIAASQRAYVGFLNKLRMDVFEDLIRKAELNGEDIGLGSKVNEDLAKVVNNFTGGARVGKVEGATPILNAAFFSPRKITSTFNILNPVNYISKKISPTARRAAIRNLFGSVATTATILKLADIMGGETLEIEEDPTSSNFGKIIAGDNKLDISGGNANYATLITRLLTQEMKSASTDIKKPLGSGFGETSGFDLIANFARYKLSPNASLLVDSVAGSNAIGEKKTFSESVLDRFKPMFLESFYELLRSSSPTAVKAIFTPVALFGGGLNTYSIGENWEDKNTKEMTEFRDIVGEEQFKEANEEYNKIIKEEIGSVKKTKYWNELSADEQIDKISKIKRDAKKQIFKEYNP